MPFSLEVEYGAELEHPAAEDLQGPEPLASRWACVPRGRVEDVARIKQVIEVPVSPYSHAPDAEAPGETNVRLLQSVFKSGVLRNHVDYDVRVAGRGATALAEIATKGRSNLRIRIRATGNDWNSRFVVVQRADLEVPRQRVNSARGLSFSQAK